MQLIKTATNPLPYRRLNSYLFVGIFVVNLYTAGIPLQRSVELWFKKRFSSASGRLDILVSSPEVTTGRVSSPDGKRLIIPEILLDEQIHEGTSPQTVHRGVWRRPASSSPDKGSNTVLTGHRFTYTGASVFYNLDKVEVGQRLAVYWDNDRYVYQVTEKKIVAPEQIEIEAPTKDDRLTIYTCTPLLTARNRLVIVASLMEKT